MPYAVAGSCPDCGAPIFVYVKVEESGGVLVQSEDYPQIHYNCDCYEGKRRKGADGESRA